MADLKLSIALAAIDKATAPLRRVREAAQRMGTGAGDAAAKLRTLEGSAEQLAAFRKLRAKTWQNTRALADLEEELTGAREKLARVTKETNGTGRAFQRATQYVSYLEKKEAGLIKRTSGMTESLERAGKALRDTGVNTDRAASETRRLAGDIERATRRANAWARVDMHFARITHAARGTAGAIGAMTGRLGNLAAATGIGGMLGGGALTAGLGGMMQGFADSGREIDIWAGRLGIGRQALQGLVAVGGRFGVAQDAMIDGLKELSLRADEFATTGAGEGDEAFKRLGLSRAQLNATKGDTEALFELVRQKMEGIQDVAARQRIADELFGGTAGEKMVEMLTTSTDELRRMRAEAERNGQILSDEDVTQARALAGGIGRLSGIMGGLAKTISAKLSPILTPLLGQFSDWIAANRELIASTVSDVVQRLSDALDRVDWGAVLAGLKDFGARIQSAVESIGGWDNALIAVGVTLSAGLIGDVVSLGASLGKLALSAIPAVIGGIRLLGVAVMTNPIGAIIGGIALAAGLIYVYWGPISDWFSGLWDRVKGLASDAWEGIKSMLGWDPLAAIGSVWEPISGFFGNVLGAIPGLASAAWDLLKTALSWTPLGLIVTNWGSISDWFSGLWDAIPGLASAAWDLLKTALSWTPLGAVVSNWEPIVGWFSGMWDRITAGFKQALDWVKRNIQPLMDAANHVGRFLGFGGDEDGGGVTNAEDLPRPSNDNARPIHIVDTAPAVETARAVAAGATTVDSHDTYQITVHAPPGLDAAEVARLVRAELDARDAARRSAVRAHLYDGTR